MTFAHRRLDPRPKLAFTVVVCVLAVAIPRLESLAALSVALVLLVAAGRGLGLREWLGFLSSFRVLLPVIFLLNLLFYGGGSVLWRLPLVPVTITEGGLYTSAVIAVRLVLIAGAAAWFAATTDAETFEAALVRLKVPWSFAFVVSLTLRLVPELRDRFATVEEAQRSRGLDVGGGPVRRVRARLPMFIPFFVSVVEYGYELSDALVVRDFDATRERTSVVRLEHRPVDYVLYGASVLLLVAILAAFGG